MPHKRFEFQDLEEVDLELPAAGKLTDKTLFLSVLSQEQLWQVLEETGVVAAIRRRGYWPLQLETEFLTEKNHRFWLLWKNEKILHLRLHLSHFRLHRHPLMPAVKLLFIDWMQTRHVLHKRELHHLFPGQDVPGLGIFPQLALFLRRLVVLTQASGGFNMPEYFHDAVLFHRAFRFYDPLREAFFRALLRDLRRHGVRAISQALQTGRVRDRDGRLCEWRSAEMLSFTHEPYAEVVFDRRYEQAVRGLMRQFSFRIVPDENPASSPR